MVLGRSWWCVTLANLNGRPIDACQDPIGERREEGKYKKKNKKEGRKEGRSEEDEDREDPG